MGLTVHYDFHSKVRTLREALALVEKLHRRARSLPFLRVDPIAKYTGKHSPEFDDDIPKWFREELEFRSVKKSRQTVYPNRAFAFLIHPGRGSETATFGLLRYPPTVKLRSGRHVPTKLSGWCWQHFCKTQYASNPRYGGFENFRRVHLSLIDLLDAAAKLGLRTKVKDESQYASHRDVEKLRQEIDEWNELIAGLGGQLKDAFPGELDAPIMRFPNFEHLEARGRKERS